ncbi:MAG: alkaline phosphatase family protein [Gammaproteobacteria bacterium]
MRSPSLLAAAILLAASASAQDAPQLSAERPTLVLAIVVDQMRYDYLSRFGTEFDSGLKRLIEEGAVFTNANYEAAPTVTAVGHSTILSGATPSVSGIAGNTWYERGEGRNVQSITDADVMPLGGGAGASPKRLLVSTIGDELKISGKGGKVYGVSLKDRSAILPAGRMADGAFWFDGMSGNFVSSNWYFDAMPAWAAEFNAAKHADRFAGQRFGDVTMPAPGPDLYGEIDASPFADQLVLDFALTVLEAEQLGTDAQTDLLSVSFSAMDYVGHARGPDTPLIREMALAIDERVGELLDAAEAQAGRGNVLVVFTADHGVAPVPEENIAKRLPGGRYDARAERDAVEAALDAAFGDGDYIEGTAELGIYLRRDPVPGKSIAYADMERIAAQTLRAQPRVARVYTRSELSAGLVDGDAVDRRVRNGFNTLHSGDLVVVHEPNWLSGGFGGTNHGSPYSYDTHVPVMFWGPANLVQPGQYHAAAAVHDIAPTLAAQLGIAQPSGATGRVLDEVLPSSRDVLSVTAPSAREDDEEGERSSFGRLRVRPNTDNTAGKK